MLRVVSGLSRSGLARLVGLALAAGLLGACPPGDDLVAGLELGPDGRPMVTECDGRCECGLSYCEQVCTRPGERLCLFSCAEGSTCDNSCPGGGCTMQCGTDATCTLGCDDGRCDGRCDDSKSCEIGCEGGGCTMTCVGTASCVMDCPGGGCSLTCDGAKSCSLLSCDADCTLDCGGAAECKASCTDGPGCSVTP